MKKYYYNLKNSTFYFMSITHKSKFIDIYLPNIMKKSYNTSNENLSG